jgi:hypothetical protein
MGLLHDLRYSARTPLKRPGFVITITLILALGIGANSTISTSYSDDYTSFSWSVLLPLDRKRDLEIELDLSLCSQYPHTRVSRSTHSKIDGVFTALAFPA